MGFIQKGSFSWHYEAFKLAKNTKNNIQQSIQYKGIDHLEKLNCKIYKIASFEITDLKLINYIASKKKPIIISTEWQIFRNKSSYKGN